MLLVNILFLGVFSEGFFKRFSLLKSNILLLIFPFVIRLILELILRLILLILI